MKKKLLVWFVLVPLVIGACLMAIPSDRYFVLGLLRSESFEDGHPVSYWIAELQDSDPEERTEAAAALGRIGGEGASQAVPALVAALKDGDEVVRRNAALALFKIGPEDADTVRALAEALEDSVADVRMDAALALRRIGPAAAPAAPALIKALQDPANRKLVGQFLASVAQVSAATLGRIGPPARDAIPALAEVYGDKNNPEPLRRDAAQALKKIDAGVKE
jgi:HEAT repeat protein